MQMLEKPPCTPEAYYRAVCAESKLRIVRSSSHVELTGGNLPGLNRKARENNVSLDPEKADAFFTLRVKWSG